MKIGVVSLGCAKNRVDTEQMLSLLSGAGHELVQAPQQAEGLIVNTCGFIQSAKEESIDAILDLARYKQKGHCRILCVTGCLAQRYGDELAKEIPEIDILAGVSQYERLPWAFEEAAAGRRVLLTQRGNRFLECGRVLTTPSYIAYIRTGEGCDNRCAYCAIPLIRGNYASRPKASILSEIRTLAAQGVQEFILIAQDTTRWGSDLGGKESLPTLIHEASAIPGVAWLRVLYCYPDETSQVLIDEMAGHDNVCKYLDLPLQHASPRILHSMRRRGDLQDIRRLLHHARNLGFALRTTFIVGFPGETQEDFEQLMQFTREMSFDRMGAFAYSAEEDTPAAEMADQVEEGVKQERLARLMQLQATISRERNALHIGSVQRVLVTGREKSQYIGRSQWEAPDADGVIRFTSDRVLTPGQFVPVRITDADTYDLSGQALTLAPGAAQEAAT